MAENDPLNTDPPENLPEPSNRKCVCEFCGCQLTPRGEVLRMGEAAKNYRKHDEVVEKKDKEIARLTEELATVTRERDTLKVQNSPEPSARRIGSRVQ